MARKKRGAAALRRALDRCQGGRIPESIPLFEKLLRRKDLPLEIELEARFWFACSLHTHGQPERGIDVLEARSRDELAMASHPALANQILSRLVLLEVDAGKPLARIRETLERARRADRRRGRLLGSRLLLARGKLLDARGRRLPARVLLEKSIERRPECSEHFALTAHMKVLMPCLIGLGRYDEFARHLKGGTHAGGERIKSALYEALQADLCRARGELEEALRWAHFARLRAAEDDDVLGAIVAAIALCRTESLTGDPARSRSAQRALCGLRHRGGALYRYRMALACVDACLARLGASLGRPLRDLELGRSHAPIGPVCRDGRRTRSELRAARRALRRCETQALALDTAFESTLYRRQLAARRRELRELARLSGRGPLPVAPSGPVCEIEPPPVGDEPQLVEAPDASWILVPRMSLVELARPVSRTVRQWLVARGDGVPDSFPLDVWRPTHRVCTLRVFPGPGSTAERSLALRMERGADSKWFAALYDSVRRHFGSALLREGRHALAAGDARAAEQQLLCAARHLPQSWEVWERCAASQLELDRVDDALESCTRALAIDSRKPDAWLTLSHILTRRGEAEDAEASRLQHEARLRKSPGRVASPS